MISGIKTATLGAEGAITIALPWGIRNFHSSWESRRRQDVQHPAHFASLPHFD
jgi:hypothetical protein